jgi:predicted transcriptional regulator
MMTIKSLKTKQSILHALADEEMIKILDCALFGAKSVSDVIRDCRIPHTTAYRKIKWLIDEGLLTIEKIEITEDGKKYSLFRSALKSVSIKYEYSSMVVEAEPNVEIVEKLTERFLSLD